MIDYQTIIENIHNSIIAEGYFGRGKKASYIPALAEVDANQYGIAVATLDGNIFTVGNVDKRFSIQSISKVFTLAMVSRYIGDDLWRYVGREPSGTPFNSLVQLEYEHGIPRNPFINAGAIVITDKIVDIYNKPQDSILDFVRLLADNNQVSFDKNVADSEIDTSSRNMALGHFMKSFGNMNNDVKRVVEIYCTHCSLSMNCVDLAKSFLFLANRGVNPHNGERILSPSRTKRMNALMLTCGLYDESGDFAFRVGMPGKSGVGGAIAAVIPGKLSIAVWSPELNGHGNSVIGVETLERFTTEIGISIF